MTLPLRWRVRIWFANLKSPRCCPNCRSEEWPQYRWCEDCWAALIKGAASTAGSLIVTWLLRLIWSMAHG